MTRSRHTSGRSFLTPTGNCERPFVREGNLLSARVAILIHVATARGLRWLLEQPSGTILAHMPWFQRLWAEVEAALGHKQVQYFDFLVYIHLLFVYISISISIKKGIYNTSNTFCPLLVLLLYTNRKKTTT